MAAARAVVDHDGPGQPARGQRAVLGQEGVHGDVEGAENVRRSISDWLCFMGLCPAGPNAELDRYIGYWKPYATSHDELDADDAVQEEVRNAARTLAEGVKASRAGKLSAAGTKLKPPRQK